MVSRVPCGATVSAHEQQLELALRLACRELVHARKYAPSNIVPVTLRADVNAAVGEFMALASHSLRCEDESPNPLEL